jgi:hypothetical protein
MDSEVAVTIFLLTTTHHLLALDDQGRFYRIHSGKGVYYGLASDHERHLYVACRNQVKGSNDDAERSRQTGSILVLAVPSFAVIGELQPEFALRDVHGIACIDGKLWVTCAYDNLVAVYDIGRRQWRKWYPSTKPAARGRDVNHFNTITTVGDRFCVVAHNNGRSHLLFYAKPSLELCSACELGREAHDAFSVGGGVATCSSRDGVLLSTAGWILRTGGYPRGIAFAGDSVLLGISQIAPRGMRHQASGVLRRFTRQWCHVADYLLSAVGMILAILPIDIDENDLPKLEPWNQVQEHRAPNLPGNAYRLGERESTVASSLEWHAGELTHRWTAAREAGMTVVVNPGETKVVVTARNGFPGAYAVEVCANGQSLGSIYWSEAKDARNEFLLPGGTQGKCEMILRVPHLWQPSSCRLGSVDDRMLGVGIQTIQIC